jgi:hypothetical protein
MTEIHASLETRIRLKRERKARAEEERMKCITGARETCWPSRI